MYGEHGTDEILGQAGNDQLDGGIDGYSDLLNGGGGKDKFRTEWVADWLSFMNIDEPVDYDSTLDSYYA